MVATRIEDCTISDDRRRRAGPSGDATVELADTGSLRLACHHFLASAGPAGSEPFFLRRVPRPDGLRRPLAAANGGALGTDDTRGTREVSPRHARPLRPVWSGRAGGQSLMDRDT